MPDSLRCRLITPTERLFDAEASYVDVPLHDGQQGIMAQTAPLVGKLGPGELRVDTGSGTKRYYIDGGFMQQLDGTLTILSTGAVDVQELNPEEERAALAEANARNATDTAEMDRISDQRRKAGIRLKLASRR